MNVLGIESSCDETAAAIVRDGSDILSSIVSSQVKTHAGFGGVVPELASREHIDNICFIVEESLDKAGMDWTDLDGVAVTHGPGLVGALLVGLSYAKALAYSRKLPFLGINHLEGHLYSVFLENPELPLPALSLVVSGGHTNLYHFEKMGAWRLLAKSKDDAAGEALDKLSRRLGTGYPGGPVIEKLAQLGNPETVAFTMPKLSDKSLDFSFSGMKTAALRYLKKMDFDTLDPMLLDTPGEIPEEILDLAAGFQESVIKQLLDRLDKCLLKKSALSIHISGGVSCNETLRRRIREHFAEKNIPVYYPGKALTTDNAAMIAAAAYYRLRAGHSDPWDLPADPNLRLKERL
ncbi:MAG: tRNA (adenosine(37)-N6)-threonylcarbamoyltransferase complex transferase subunit TsaD [Acidobacteriota bacterium]